MMKTVKVVLFYLVIFNLIFTANLVQATVIDTPIDHQIIILRDDDASFDSPSPELKWLINFTIEYEIPVTLGVIPKGDGSFINYLSSLNRTSLNELALHGYRHCYYENGTPVDYHTHPKSIPEWRTPYEDQKMYLKNATELFINYTGRRPTSFIPPYNAHNSNTIKVLGEQGYHVISGAGYKGHMHNNGIFELSYCMRNENYDNLTQYINDYNEYGRNEPYMVLLSHHWASFTTKEKKEAFSQFIGYLEKQNVQFMTMNEAYEWEIDRPCLILTDENGRYLLNASACNFNHTIKFIAPISWSNQTIILSDITNGSKVGTFTGKTFKFKVLYGHQYTIQKQRQDNYWLIFALTLVLFLRIS